VIFSCVRAQAQAAAGGAGRARIGFLQDVRRMNVALTRARRALWVLAHTRTLAASDAWRPLLEHASERGLVYQAAQPFGRLWQRSGQQLCAGAPTFVAATAGETGAAAAAGAAGAAAGGGDGAIKRAARGLPAAGGGVREGKAAAPGGGKAEAAAAAARPPGADGAAATVAPAPAAPEHRSRPKANKPGVRQGKHAAGSGAGGAGSERSLPQPLPARPSAELTPALPEPPGSDEAVPMDLGTQPGDMAWPPLPPDSPPPLPPDSPPPPLPADCHHQ